MDTGSRREARGPANKREREQRVKERGSHISAEQVSAAVTAQMLELQQNVSWFKWLQLLVRKEIQ